MQSTSQKQFIEMNTPTAKFHPLQSYTDVFTKSYFEFESVSPKNPYGQTIFSEDHKESIVSDIMTMLKLKWFKNISRIAHHLAVVEMNNNNTLDYRTLYDRHQFRLRSWYKKYEPKLPTKPLPIIDAPQKTLQPNFTRELAYEETKPPVTSIKVPPAVQNIKFSVEILKQTDTAIVKENFYNTLRSLSKSAITNGIVQADVLKILERAYTDQVEENKVVESTVKLEAFLRENKIERDIALKIIEGI